MIKIGIIGCGAISKRYIDIFDEKKISNSKIISVCDKNFQKAKTLAFQIKAEAYCSIDEMLKKEKIDLSIILTPSGLHYKHSKTLLKYGAHVITEKPMALKLSDAKELIRLSKSKNLMYGVVFQNRFNKSIKFLKSIIDDGAIGKRVLSTVRLRWCRHQEYYSNSWHGTWKMDGGVISQQAIHHLDILQWLGGSIKKVCSTSSSIINSLEAEDTSVSILDFNDGSHGVIEATTAARPIDYEASLSVLGENGLVEIGGIALNKIINFNLKNKKYGARKIIKENSEDTEFGYGNGHKPFFEEVINRLSQNRTDPPISPTESFKSLILVHAIYKSNEINSWVNIEDEVESNFLGK